MRGIRLLRMRIIVSCYLAGLIFFRRERDKKILTSRQ